VGGEEVGVNGPGVEELRGLEAGTGKAAAGTVVVGPL
jgi:hypothetical protein